jgi:hypothetical protein
MPNYVPVDFEAFFRWFSEYFFGLPKKTALKDEFIFVLCGCKGPGKRIPQSGYREKDGKRLSLY